MVILWNIIDMKFSRITVCVVVDIIQYCDLIQYVNIPHPY